MMAILMLLIMVDMEIKIKVAKLVIIHQITQANTILTTYKITVTVINHHNNPAYLVNLPSQIAHHP